MMLLELQNDPQMDHNKKVKKIVFFIPNFNKDKCKIIKRNESVIIMMKSDSLKILH